MNLSHDEERHYHLHVCHTFKIIVVRLGTIGPLLEIYICLHNKPATTNQEPSETYRMCPRKRQGKDETEVMLFW